MSFIEEFTKDELKEKLLDNVKVISRKTIKNASSEHIYEALALTIRDIMTDRWIATQETYYEKDVKIVYYLSMEFLMGRFLGNSILNLTKSGVVKEVFDELGIDFNAIEEA